jgi:hypothetical protein
MSEASGKTHIPPEMEPHVFKPNDLGYCDYQNANLARCRRPAVWHMMDSTQREAFDKGELAEVPVRGSIRYRGFSNDVSPNGPKVCGECGNGLFKLDLRHGLIVLTCHGCDEETEVPWGVLRGHLAEPQS